MSTQSKTARRLPVTTSELCLFSMLGALMFVSKLMLEFLPNIHMVGMLTVLYTVVFRKKALIPIYVYVLLLGVYAGFNLWWIPNLYLWTVLWGVTMLLPRKMPRAAGAIIYPVVCGLHGLAYGTLYAPSQAIMYGLSFRGMLAWIAAGLPWDVTHAIGNLCFGTLILPLSELMKRLRGKIIGK